MKANVMMLPGDGVGPEVAASVEKVLTEVGRIWGHDFTFEQGLIGGASIDACGESVTETCLKACQASDAVFLGAVGGPKWDGGAVRPEQGLLALRKALGVYANIRPVQPHPCGFAASPIRPDRLRGVDLLFVRELTGGIYFGDKVEGQQQASDLCSYSADEVARVVRRAAQLAMGRRSKLTLVDKANVMATSRLWRQVTEKVMAEEFPSVKLEVLLVDAAAMHLLSRARDFDVIVTDNLFGDILTDEASMLCGSMGMMPSASLGDGRASLYEPIHGSAPDIAGQNVANPIGAILSGAMLLEYSLGLLQEATAVRRAVNACLDHGLVTRELAAMDQAALSTKQVTQEVIDQVNGCVIQNQVAAAY